MNLFRKFASVALVVTTIMSISAVDFGNVTEVKADENKLSFTVMCDGTVLSEDNGAAEFYNQLNEKLDCDITWIRPDHNDYYNYVEQAFTSGDMPDVVLLSKDYLDYYAYNGYLWNMSEAWNNSKTLNSDKLSDYAIKYIEANGSAYFSDGKKGMYGFTPQRGQGTVTYIKASELRKAGYDPEVIKNANLTFDEYYDILKKIKKNTSEDYILSPPGFYMNVGTSSYRTRFLPEFYQNAEWSFYRNADGEFVDGFTEQAMIDAINRIKTAVNDKIIEKSAQNHTTSTSRLMFRRNDGGDSKVFSYYCGVWGNTLRVTNDSTGADSELIAIKPVNNGKYIDSLRITWAIVDKKDGRQQQIFDRFIDTMLDGRDIQMLWTYGAKGTHWDTKAETITVGSKSYSYQGGEFHRLPKLDNKKAFNSRNFIDPVSALSDFDDDMLDGQVVNPVDKLEYAKEVKEELDMFLDNSVFEIEVPYTPVLGENITDINTVRGLVVDQVVLGNWTIEYAMAQYDEMVGKKVEAVLEGFKEYTFNEKSSITDIIKNNNLEYIVNKDSSGKQMLTGVKPELKADYLKKGFGDNIVIKNADGTQLSDDTVVGTGCVVELIQDENVIDTVTVVVKGDTDGSGTIDVLDMEAIQKSILGIGDKLAGVYKEAALLSDSDDITVLDMESIQKDILGIQKIN